MKLSAAILGWAAAMGLSLGQTAYAEGDKNEPSQSEYGDTDTGDEDTQAQSPDTQPPDETQPGMENEPGAEVDQPETEQAQQDTQKQEQLKYSKKAVKKNQRDVIQFRKMSKAERRDMQTALKEQGLYEAEIDGIVGPKTLIALRTYQKQNSLPVTGKLTVATAESLGLGLMVETQPVAGTMSKSGKVDKAMIEDAQMQLQQQGLYKGEIDGIVGPKTRAALREYQRQNDLPVNGRLTSTTLSQLGINTWSEDTQSLGDEIDQAGEEMEELGDEAEDTADEMVEDVEDQQQQQEQQQQEQQQQEQQQQEQQQQQEEQQDLNQQQPDDEY